MKIIKKAAILPCECQYCHSVFQPRWKDLVKSERLVKEDVLCPLCGGRNYVSLEERSTENAE